MSMFIIPVWDILTSYAGDSKEFGFDGEIYPGYYDDINFLEPLRFHLKIIGLDDGVEAVFTKFYTTIEFEWKKHPISIENFERSFKKQFDPITDPDDIYPINTSNMSIDLWPIIREEIIMATF